VNDAESVRAIHRALDLGVNFFDTAAAYGTGHSERLLSRAFAGRRDNVIIATKFGKLVDEEKNWIGRYPNDDEVVKHVRRECEASLRRLNTDYIDLYQFHLLDFPLDRAGEVRDILEALVAEGKIRFYSWSTDDPERARFFAEGEHCVAVQFRMNVVDAAPEMLALCSTCDQAGIIRGPLANGFLSGKYTTDNIDVALAEGDFRMRGSRERILKIIESLDGVRDVLISDGRTLVQGALAWIWARSGRTIPIPGFRTLAQVEENIKALEFGPLSTAQMSQIDHILDREVEKL
jgi:aryl-alcohol dehydrogenase-like predicted oxidoreductase